MSLNIEDAERTLIRYLESNILGIGILQEGEDPTKSSGDLGQQILSKAFTPEKIGRVMAAPPDPKWIKAHVPSLAFWMIGYAPKSDYHIKKKYVTSDSLTKTVSTREEFYRARLLLQVESYWRTNLERKLMHAQLSTLVNVPGRGTGRIPTLAGDFIYLKVIESREPQENEFVTQGIYRLIHTWELRVRELVPITEGMLQGTKVKLKLQTNLGTQPVY